MDTAVKCVTAFYVHVHILRIWRDIDYDENLGMAGLMVVSALVTFVTKLTEIKMSKMGTTKLENVV